VRHVDSDFQESAYFFVAMFSQLQLYALGVPVILAIGESSTSVRFLIFTILIAVNNVVLVLLLMLPKVMNIDVLSAFGNSSSINNGTAHATAGDPKSSMGSMTKTSYAKTKEDIYTIHDDDDIDFDEILKLQRPSITFDEMYGASTSSIVVDKDDDDVEKKKKRTSVVVA